MKKSFRTSEFDLAAQMNRANRPACILPRRKIFQQVTLIQSNFNGSNTFGTMKISSRQE